MIIAFLLLAVTTLTAAQSGSHASLPDFSGRWQLAAQETSAFRRRAHIGNHEEPVVIVQTQTQISIAVQSEDPSGHFTCDLTDAPPPGTRVKGDTLTCVSRWNGGALLIEGRRLFTSQDGPTAYDFVESRSLSAETGRMIVVTRIKMFPQDLVRTSEYTRVK